MDWILLPYKRYFDFSGRSQRKEYWMFMLGVPLVVILLSIVELLVGLGGLFIGFITGIFVLASLIPAIAVQVRRFHDQDKSGWFVLLNFIPYVGGLIVLVFMCLEGTRGTNRFGADPKDLTDPGVFA